MAAQLLSARQLDVLRLTARGLSCKQIGPMLNISDKTVNQRRGQIFRAIGVSNSVQATRWAIAHGVIPAPTQEDWR